MTTLLICNIGNRDIYVDPKFMPDEIQAATHRDRIAYIREQLASLKPQIELAMIRKVLDYINIDELDQIILFGSQQPDQRYQHTDTLDTAYLVREIISQRWNFSHERIMVRPLTVDPARQNSVMQFYEQALPELDRQFMPNQVYLEVTGGTPAMSNALQLAGTEIFQERAIALYVSRDSELPQRLAIGRRILGGPLRKVIKANLATFQYTAALESWGLYRPYFTDLASEGSATLIEGILQHAAARINLNIPKALVAIRGLDGLSDGLYYPLINQLYNAIYPLSREQALAEIFAIAEVRLQTRLYADFLTQLVRFVENSLRMVCLRLHIPFRNHQNQPDEHGAKIDETWLKQQKIDKINIGQAGLQRVLKLYAPENPDVQVVLNLAESCKQLIYLRNEITHSLSGVSRAAIEKAFGNRIEVLLELLQTSYHQLTQQSLPSNPYQQINQWIERLLVVPTDTLV